MIYFLQPLDGGPVKIGCSVDVGRRQRQLEGIYGRPLALLATMPGDRKVERRIHTRFARLRLGRSEQFRPARELLEFIGRPALVSANPDTIEAMPVDSRSIRLELTEDQHARLRVVAAQAGLSMAAFARTVVIRALDAPAGKPAPKRPKSG